MDSKIAKDWRANWQAVNAYLLEEKRQKSAIERLRACEALLDRLKTMGKLPPKDEGEHEIWANYQRRYLEQQRKSS